MALAKLASLKAGASWPEAAKIAGQSLRRLLGAEYRELVGLTETEMFAALTRKSPTHLVPWKMTVLVALLKEAGDVATAQHPPNGGYGWYLKALHLLLEATASKNLLDDPGILPTADVLLRSIADSPIPVRTRLLLIGEHERRGEYSGALVQLRLALEQAPGRPLVKRFATSLLKRLLGQPEGVLTAGGTTRDELTSALQSL